MIKVLISLFVISLSTGGVCGAPGIPGVQWTEEQAKIIRSKILQIWMDPETFTADFDFGTPEAKNTDFLYDPNLSLSTPDCDLSEPLCSVQWEKNRLDHISFQERKAVRLGFHDCVKYKDGSGGCDGCLNFDENFGHNHGLQHTVAILEKIYIDVDFPPLPEGKPNLPASPKDLGISRADLWAFASILALSRFEENTKIKCNQWEQELTCGDGSCFIPMPDRAKFMFKTGRKDCIPNPAASKKNQYRSSKVENHPGDGFNGEMTVKFFKEEFGFNGRQALALMGAHTMGQFNQVTSQVDYGWVRVWSNQTAMLNNKYYRYMTGKDMYMKDFSCVGKYGGGRATQHWRVMANVFPNIYGYPEVWSTKEDPGRLVWTPFYERGPNCKFALGDEEDSRDNQFWNDTKIDEAAQKHGFVSGFEWCCQQQFDGCDLTGTCDPICTKRAHNKVRHLSVDVGFYLDFEIDEFGVPKGCGGFFDNAWKGEPRTEENYRYTKYINGKSGYTEGNWACPKQKLDDGHGSPLWKTAEFYADNNKQWIEDFTDVFGLMLSNGNDDLVQGPTEFWKQRCCYNYVSRVRGKNFKTYKPTKNAIECQKRCQDYKDSQGRKCEAFEYRMFSTADTCRLFNNIETVIYDPSPDDEYIFVSGPKECPAGENFCDAYENY